MQSARYNDETLIDNMHLNEVERMSHAFYNLQWQKAMEELAEQIDVEVPPPQLDINGKPLPIEKEKEITWDQAWQHYACLYVRYIQIFRKLEDCYDQIVHPQKRKDIKLALECVMARICQVKRELVRFGPDGRQSDFVNVEQLLLDLRLSPEDIELPVPRYFAEPNEHDDTSGMRQAFLTALADKGIGAGGAAGAGTAAGGAAGGDDDDGYGGYGAGGDSKDRLLKMTPQQAIRIIQRNERGRQGAERAKRQKKHLKEQADERAAEEQQKQREINEKNGVSKTSEKDRERALKDGAAVMIQKNFKAHLGRLIVRDMMQRELEFIEMKPVERKATADANRLNGGPPIEVPTTSSLSLSHSLKMDMKDSRLLSSALNGVQYAGATGGSAAAAGAAAALGLGGGGLGYGLGYGTGGVGGASGTTGIPGIGGAHPVGAAAGGVSKPTATQLIAARREADKPEAEAERRERERRKWRQREYEANYATSLNKIEALVEATEGPAMRDVMWNERSAWWIEYKARTGKYPDKNFDLFELEQKIKADPALAEQIKKQEAAKYLKKMEKREKLRMKTMGRQYVPSDWETQRRKDEANAKRASGGSRAQSQAFRPRNKKDIELEKLRADKLTNATLVGPSALIQHMLETVTKYRNVWAVLDESKNPNQEFDEGLAKDNRRPVVREKTKKAVEKDLFAYLEGIKAKVKQLDAAAKKKKGKKKTKKQKEKEKAEAEAKAKAGGAGADGKAADVKIGPDGKEIPATAAAGTSAGDGAVKKKGKKGKGGKALKPKKKAKCCAGEKECKDWAPKAKIDELYNNNILQEAKPKWKSLHEYVGNINLLGAHYMTAGQPLDPSMSQIRQCITEYCILPLGSQYVKDTTPAINAVLLYGAAGSGKTMLSRAIAKQTGAVWFDLSPSNVRGRLTGHPKQDIQRIVHLVFELAKALQPSVIYIDEIEALFSKSKKRAPELARIAKCVIAHKDRLGASDRVLVVANSTRPFEEKADRRELLRYFGYKHSGKMLYLPCPGYTSRLKLWTTFIDNAATAHGATLALFAQNPKFDLSTLAYISEGYSAGSIQSAVQSTVTANRVKRVIDGKNPLEASEFIAALSKTAYLYRGDHKSFTKFAELVTGEKDRKKAKAEAEAIDAAAAEKDNKSRAMRSRTVPKSPAAKK